MILNNHVQDIISKFQEAIAAARRNLSALKYREFEELVTKYGDIFAKKSDDFGRTDQLYRCIHTGDSRTISQIMRFPPRKIGGGERDARGHATPWSYGRFREPLVILHRSRPQETRGLKPRRRVQETERCQKEKNFRTVPD
jgi:hypothetical protein